MRGTSGSGKSTAVRRVLEKLKLVSTVMEDGRRRPLAYIHALPSGSEVATLGSYESTCGGCDTIKGLDRTFELVRLFHSQGKHVLFEGLLLSEGTDRILALQRDGLPIHCIALTTSLEECLASVQLRREASAEKRGKVPTLLDPTNTSKRVKVIERSLARIRAAGVPVHDCSRELAVVTACQLLGL